jgi:hypothetical protein
MTRPWLSVSRAFVRIEDEVVGETRAIRQLETTPSRAVTRVAYGDSLRVSGRNQSRRGVPRRRARPEIPRTAIMPRATTK